LLSGPALQHAVAQSRGEDPPARRARETARRTLQWESLLMMLDEIDPGYRQ
jgi:hypothetical protein